VSDINWAAEQLTADYVGTFDLRFSEGFRTSLSWGGQSVVNRETSLGASGRTLPGPGDHVVSSGARFTASESRSRVVNAGIFAQSLFDFNDRYFLTVALRIDGNSAFGDDFGLQPYPRATFSWVMSDEGFWPEGLGELKARITWGHAGRAPGAFDAVRTWGNPSHGSARRHSIR
jgi:outer membrane receptor protein involved in Fe transport